MSVHFLVRLAPLPGREAEFREELRRVVEASRAEAGCLAIHAFESLREPPEFAIHSEWVDEAAFERHARLPHTERFLRAAETLLTHDIAGLRARRIAGGAGQGAAEAHAAPESR
ncbi:MAG TPA: putative quinol monooxygenase [Bryobacteraceae bacterium]|jgi:quinol monooxygenase YgiN|nr:putative quinol monooxygenase [Bryobacteraceae bacterium]